MLPTAGDLTAKARIRAAAFELFASQGVGATSMRSVAAKAGVSPSLVVHHFRSKARLREAVDDALVSAFSDVLADIDTSQPPEQVGRQLEERISNMIGRDGDVRAYLARSLLESTPASHRLFGALMDLVDAGLAALDAQGLLRPGLDPAWRSYTVASIVLGPVLLGPQMEARAGGDVFEPATVQARSACNMAIVQHGLFRQP